MSVPKTSITPNECCLFIGSFSFIRSDRGFVSWLPKFCVNERLTTIPWTEFAKEGKERENSSGTFFLYGVDTLCGTFLYVSQSQLRRVFRCYRARILGRFIALRSQNNDMTEMAKKLSKISWVINSGRLLATFDKHFLPYLKRKYRFPRLQWNHWDKGKVSL